MFNLTEIFCLTYIYTCFLHKCACDKTWFITYYKRVFWLCFYVQYCFMSNLAEHLPTDQVLDTNSLSIFMKHISCTLLYTNIYLNCWKLHVLWQTPVINLHFTYRWWDLRARILSYLFVLPIKRFFRALTWNPFLYVWFPPLPHSVEPSGSRQIHLVFWSVTLAESRPFVNPPE